MRWILLLLLLIPALEIGIFIWVGGMIGPWWVVALIILTGILGLAIAKRQGMETWYKAQQAMRYGKLPGEQIFDGICIMIGAVLLVTPGFLTDITGFLLVLPTTRNWFKGILYRLLNKLFSNKTIITFRRW